MRPWHAVPLLALTLAASGCYTTVVETGREPSRHRVRDEWVMGFASGLVMVERVNAELICAPAGVARVKTETSFPNFLVQTFTAGVLSPRTVEVTCAATPGQPFRWASKAVRLHIEHDHEHEHEFEHEHRLQHEFEHEFEHEFQQEFERELRVELERGIERAGRHRERAERARVRIRVPREHHLD